jgi:hypothetical protein
MLEDILKTKLNAPQVKHGRIHQKGLSQNAIKSIWGFDCGTKEMLRMKSDLVMVKWKRQQS